MKKILIVEDEQPLLSAISKKLTGTGYTILTAKNGVEAVRVFSKERPDLMVLDLIMPEQNGFAVLETIRLKKHSKIPIIILSNLERAQDIDTGKHLGANEYLIKSNISLRELMVHIDRFLQEPVAP